jgi:hypothetical protein
MKKEYLGDVALTCEPFPGVDEILLQFQEPPFHALSVRKKFKRINKTLLDLIEAAKEPCFLLPQVIDYITRVNEEKILNEPYRFISFEFWLNRFSKLSDEENYAIRAKIVGKHIPREEYGAYFPISSGKTFSGTHFVAAHTAPDIDSTIASFWGWVDAFGAKIAEGVHQWSMPGKLPNSHFAMLFESLFGPGAVETIARPTPTLTLSAQDLVTQKDMVRVHVDSHISTLDHTHVGKAIVLVDDNECYRGDWRSADAEQARQVSMLFATTIRWFENVVHAKLISTFAKKVIHIHDIKNAIDPLFEAQVKNGDPIKDFTEKQKRQLNDYLRKIIGLQKGIQCTFFELWTWLDPISSGKFTLFYDALQSLFDPELYDRNDRLIEDRPKIFTRLEKIIIDLDDLIFTLRNYIDRLSVLIEVKDKVLGTIPQFVTLRSDVEEIRTKIDNLEYLTVVIPEDNGAWFPVGIIPASDLKRPVLGTCSLRDFSNPHETQMASYLEIISVIDHHKTELTTSSAPCFVISDAQSSNTLLAELAMQINSNYSLLGTTGATLEKELAGLHGKTSNSKELRAIAKLLELKANLHTHGNYFIHHQREFYEYLCFLYAILDDTDLLSKISPRDVTVVAKLLNRMKSISTSSTSDIISLDDIPRDSQFARAAAKRILQNRDMYSIYSKIYEYKEQEMEATLAACVAGNPSTVFADTKEQNGCCRVGQTKIFGSNYTFFSTYVEAIRTIWLADAKKIYETTPHLDFHLHMISTIPGAQEVFSGHLGGWDHKDEMWLWVPSTQQGIDRLTNFLSGFQATPDVQNNEMECEFLGANWHELAQAFSQNFPKAIQRPIDSGEPPHGLAMAVLYFRAGSLNSRKAQITPYLPRFVP